MFHNIQTRLSEISIRVFSFRLMTRLVILRTTCPLQSPRGLAVACPDLGSVDGFNTHLSGTLRCRWEGASRPSTEPTCTHTRWGTRDTVDDMQALGMCRLSHDGWLHSGLTCKYSWTVDGHPRGDIRVTAAADHVVLNYRTRKHGGDWQDVSYSVQIDRTPCHLGGTRA
jgi:hypothetical protein